jgi:aminoglycoside phosphotransferase
MAVEAIRRIDWRFLLPEPVPGRAVLVSRDERWRDQLEVALQAAGVEAVHRLAIDPSGIKAGDLVVLDGLRHPVSAMVQDLPPRSSVLAELTRAGEGWPRLAGPHTRLVAWPRLDRAIELVPVHGPNARALFARRRSRRAGFRGMLRSIVLAPPLSRFTDRLVLANAAGEMGGLLQLAARHLGADAARSPWTLVTPRFRASHHVVMILGDRLVLKAQRDPTGRSVAREAMVLEAVAPRLRHAEAAPAVVAVDHVGSHPVLLETALSGAPLTPARVRRAPEAVVRSIAGWLRPLVTAVRPVDDAWRATVLAEPLHALRGLGGDAADLELETRAEAVLERLAGALVAGAIEHGDLGDPNLLITADGSLGVIDWELGRVDGVALLDLAFAISYVAGAASGASSAEEHADAWETVALDSRGWGRRVLLEEAAAAGLRPEVVPPLLVLCWIRQLATLMGRVAGDPRSATAIRSHRYWAILRRTVQRST